MVKNKKRKFTARLVIVIASVLMLVFALYFAGSNMNLTPNIKRGSIVDSLNGVYVYHNGGVNQLSGRNVNDGYNIGMKYQCVEFVKRYYYEHYQHKMPDSYGHAKDFFDQRIADGDINKQRALVQYSNGAGEKPQIGDLIVFDSYIWNPYGHVAIVSAVADDMVEIIQQNYGPWGSSREEIAVSLINGHWKIQHNRVMGWLRKTNK